MKLPETIEVLNRTYTVTERDLSEASYLGKSKFVEGTIVIEQSLDPQAKADVLLHEIIHLILIAMGHDFNEGDLHTEKNVLVISNGLSAFIRDNPGLMQTIEKGLK